jgi:uncharacterized membrane protein YagU involved in acid resistance
MPRLLTRRTGVGPWDLLAGAAGGIAGTASMTRTEAVLRHRRAPGPELGDPPPVRMASKLSLMLRGRPPAAEHASRNGRLVSYGFGAFFAAGYGALSAVVPRAAAGRGLAFGAAVWFVGNGVTTPLLGVTEPLYRREVEDLMVDLAAHLVYGTTAEQIRRSVLKLRRRPGSGGRRRS